jgi:hypothetical protein
MGARTPWRPLFRLAALGLSAMLPACATTAIDRPASPADIVVFYRAPELVKPCALIRNVKRHESNKRHPQAYSVTCRDVLNKVRRDALKRGGNAILVTDITSSLCVDCDVTEVFLEGRVLSCPVSVIAQANSYDLPSDCF